MITLVTTIINSELSLLSLPVMLNSINSTTRGEKHHNIDQHIANSHRHRKQKQTKKNMMIRNQVTVSVVLNLIKCTLMKKN